MPSISPAFRPPPPPGAPDPTTQPKTDTLGIISITMALLFLYPIGLIVGLAGVHQAKDANRPTTLSQIGWIVNLCLCIVGLLVVAVLLAAAPSSQRAQRDTARRADLAVISAELTNFYSQHQYYPSSLSGLGTAVPTTDPTGHAYTYQPAPKDCTKCKTYILETTLENGQSTERYQISSE